MITKTEKNMIDKLEKDGKKPVVSRIAPSPTAKFLHLGNIRTMLFNYFLAKQTGGKFILRLEDTDRTRYTPSFIPYLKETLNWLGIEPDESPWKPNPNVGSYVQSERDYSQRVNFLLDNGLAYYAFDSKEELEAAHKSIPNFKYDSVTRVNMKNSLTLSKEKVDELLKTIPYVVRFKVEPNIDVTFNDQIAGDITINSSTLDDKVMMKSDGIPSYHLANVCDDHDMGVTHVLRGQEWVNSTPLHVMMYKVFGWDIPLFAHLPLIMNPDGKGKLSKRNAGKFGVPIAPIAYTDESGTVVPGWRELGYSPEAFINFLSLIGWHPSGDKEVMTMDELIQDFDLTKVVGHGARLDMKKAPWFNNQHIHLMEDSEIIDYIKSNVDLGIDYSHENWIKISQICKDRAHFMSDIKDIANIFSHRSFTKIDTSDNFKMVFNHFVQTGMNIDWDAKSIKESIFGLCESYGLKMGKIMPDLRNCITGGVSGPDLVTTMEVIGRDETKKRLLNSLV